MKQWAGSTAIHTHHASEPIFHHTFHFTVIYCENIVVNFFSGQWIHLINGTIVTLKSFWKKIYEEITYFNVCICTIFFSRFISCMVLILWKHRRIIRDSRFKIRDSISEIWWFEIQYLKQPIKRNSDFFMANEGVRVLNAHFQQYFRYIMVVSFIGGGKPAHQEKTTDPEKTMDLPQVTDKLYHIMLYQFKSRISIIRNIIICKQ